MPIPIDDLSVGQWVFITDSESIESYSFFGDQSRTVYPVDGRPLKIKAISLPFIVVTDTDQRYNAAIDTREVDLTRADAKYVKAMTGRAASRGGRTTATFRADGSEAAVEAEKKKEKSEPEPMACPVCQERMVERLIPGTDGDWMLHCKQCGFEGGRPSKGGP